MIVVPGSIWKDLGACTWLCISIIIQPYQKKTMHWQIEYRKMSTKITNGIKRLPNQKRNMQEIKNGYKMSVAVAKGYIVTRVQTD